jgi:ABC-2 type transport system permease protein
MITLAIMMATTLLLVSGFGLRMIGVAPSAEEIIRLFIYFVSIVIFGAFWMGLAILFSVIIRNLAVSLLASLAVWLFFGFFYTLLIVPAVAKSVDLYLLLVRLSPNTLFDEATMAMLLPQSRGLGLFASSEISYMILNPLPLGQSLLLVWPQLVTMIGLAAVCFAVSYVVFMRQEIRAT